MFALKSPCSNCPFRRPQGLKFNLGIERVLEILNAEAFPCHKTTIDNSKGVAVQQCAGVMSLLHRADMPNSIMQVGERMGEFDPRKLQHFEVYKTIDDALDDHSFGEWSETGESLDDCLGPSYYRRQRALRIVAPQRLIRSSEPTRGRMPNVPRAWERGSAEPLEGRYL